MIWSILRAGQGLTSAITYEILRANERLRDEGLIIKEGL
jgi:phage tail protein X